MADIRSAATEIRQGIKKERRRKKLQGINIMANFIVLNFLNYSAKFSHLTHQNYQFATSNFFTARTI